MKPVRATDVSKRVIVFPSNPKKERYAVLRYIGTTLSSLRVGGKESLVYTALPALHHFTESSANRIA